MPADDELVTAPPAATRAGSGAVSEDAVYEQPSAVGAYLDNTRALHRTFAREVAAVVESLTSTGPTRHQERVTC